MGEGIIKISECLGSKARNLNEFLEEIFPGIKYVVNEGLSKSFNDDAWITRITSGAIICAINDDCQEINEKMKNIDWQLFLYKSIDKFHDETVTHNRTTINFACHPIHHMSLN